jgi:hypothetical protein
MTFLMGGLFALVGSVIGFFVGWFFRTVLAHMEWAQEHGHDGIMPEEKREKKAA